jgi:hypothetical protein
MLYLQVRDIGMPFLTLCSDPGIVYDAVQNKIAMIYLYLIEDYLVQMA